MKSEFTFALTPTLSPQEREFLLVGRASIARRGEGKSRLGFAEDRRDFTLSWGLTLRTFVSLNIITLYLYNNMLCILWRDAYYPCILV